MQDVIVVIPDLGRCVIDKCSPGIDFWFKTVFRCDAALSGSLPGRPTHTLKEMRCVRKKTSSVRKPTKAAWKVTASMATKPYPEFDFRHKFSLLVVGPTQCGKTYFVQQILKHNRIVYKEQMCIRIFWYNNQW